MYIDSHVHCRDEEQAYKGETISHALEVARDSGVDAIFDMPNVERPVENEERVKERLALAEKADIDEVRYGLFIGLTKNPEQIKRAVSTYRKFFPKVVGFKLYCGHSVGNLGVINLEDQDKVYGALTEEGFDGILYDHSEKESKMNKNIGVEFNPQRPITHCMARPWQSEYESVKDQITLAKFHKFKGKMHIAHISHPKSVDLVIDAKKSGLDISCGVCPHHIFYDSNKMKEESGILWKMNPPLRDPGTPLIMLEYLREGKIDWIETDHAPHSFSEKKFEKIMSGIPCLPWWTLFDEYLRQNNFSEEQRRKITFDNIASRFGIDVKRSVKPIKNRRNDYAFNSFKDLEEKLGWKI